MLLQCGFFTILTYSLCTLIINGKQLITYTQTLPSAAFLLHNAELQEVFFAVSAHVYRAGSRVDGVKE
ncbi:hypothetical protein JOQ06_008198 [Pogonophryne albipinna]|uniref:Uncharacterized protein n=1 Tax=Pogonophryne albipinna TaxID=1090488 RepID=A0AAD6AJ27_9TELE|nr:hypothetical protein JOQ06_008198 [Pogonophryne albipinna]